MSPRKVRITKRKIQEGTVKSNNPRSEYYSDYYLTHANDFHTYYIKKKIKLLNEQLTNEKNLNKRKELVEEINAIKNNKPRPSSQQKKEEMKQALLKHLGQKKYDDMGRRVYQFQKGVLYYVYLLGGIEHISKLTIPKVVVDYIYNSTFYPSDIPIANLGRFVEIYNYYTAILKKRGRELSKNEISSFYKYAKNKKMTQNNFLEYLKTWK